MSAPAAKKQRTDPGYELLYHPVIPGRGEYIRLAFEIAKVPYGDPANQEKDGYSKVQSVLSGEASTIDGNPPAFAPPALRVPGAGPDSAPLIISQTPNILFYLAPKLGLTPADEPGQLHVNALTLTALDLSNEAHDTHHPVAVMQYYEDQKPEALKKSKDFRENRVPKYFSYFERVLKGNEAKGKGRYLVGEKVSIADTTIWQVIDGLFYAFPKELEARKSEFPTLLGVFYDGLKGDLDAYLKSERRLEYSTGLFRRYPELDRE